MLILLLVLKIRIESNFIYKFINSCYSNSKVRYLQSSMCMFLYVEGWILPRIIPRAILSFFHVNIIILAIKMVYLSLAPEPCNIILICDVDVDTSQQQTNPFKVIHIIIVWSCSNLLSYKQNSFHINSSLKHFYDFIQKIFPIIISDQINHNWRPRNNFEF